MRFAHGTKNCSRYLSLKLIRVLLLCGNNAEVKFSEVVAPNSMIPLSNLNCFTLKIMLTEIDHCLNTGSTGFT